MPEETNTEFLCRPTADPNPLHPEDYELWRRRWSLVGCLDELEREWWRRAVRDLMLDLGFNEPPQGAVNIWLDFLYKERPDRQRRNYGVVINLYTASAVCCSELQSLAREAGNMALAGVLDRSIHRFSELARRPDATNVHSLLRVDYCVLPPSITALVSMAPAIRPTSVPPAPAITEGKLQGTNEADRPQHQASPKAPQKAESQ
jgi:hypothetical protein